MPVFIQARLVTLSRESGSCFNIRAAVGDISSIPFLCYWEDASSTCAHPPPLEKTTNSMHLKALFHALCIGVVAFVSRNFVVAQLIRLVTQREPTAVLLFGRRRCPHRSHSFTLSCVFDYLGIGLSSDFSCPFPRIHTGKEYQFLHPHQRLPVCHGTARLRILRFGGHSATNVGQYTRQIFGRHNEVHISYR